MASRKKLNQATWERIKQDDPNAARLLLQLSDQSWLGFDRMVENGEITCEHLVKKLRRTQDTLSDVIRIISKQNPPPF